MSTCRQGILIRLFAAWVAQRAKLHVYQRLLVAHAFVHVPGKHMPRSSVCSGCITSPS